MEKLTFTTETGETEEFFIVEETKLQGMTYILVADSEQSEANAFILKDVSGAEDKEACYVMLENESELSAVSKIFEELLEDTDIE